MAARLDTEEVLNKIEATLRAKINDYISNINTEKGDTIILKPVHENAYLYQTLDDYVANYNPSLYYGVFSCDTQGQYGAVAKNLKIEVTFILADAQEGKGVVSKKLLRYLRCLEDLFTENYASIIGMREKVKIYSLEPISFKLENMTTESKAIGVIIELDIS